MVVRVLDHGVVWCRVSTLCGFTAVVMRSGGVCPSLRVVVVILRPPQSSVCVVVEALVVVLTSPESVSMLWPVESVVVGPRTDFGSQPLGSPAEVERVVVLVVVLLPAAAATAAACLW